MKLDTVIEHQEEQLDWINDSNSFHPKTISDTEIPTPTPTVFQSRQIQEDVV